MPRDLGDARPEFDDGLEEGQGLTRGVDPHEVVADLPEVLDRRAGRVVLAPAVDGYGAPDRAVDPGERFGLGQETPALSALSITPVRSPAAAEARARET